MGYVGIALIVILTFFTLIEKAKEERDSEFSEQWTERTTDSKVMLITIKNNGTITVKELK